jgi:hypothetical protein
MNRQGKSASARATPKGFPHPAHFWAGRLRQLEYRDALRHPLARQVGEKLASNSLGSSLALSHSSPVEPILVGRNARCARLSTMPLVLSSTLKIKSVAAGSFPSLGFSLRRGSAEIRQIRTLSSRFLAVRRVEEFVYCFARVPLYYLAACSLQSFGLWFR